MVSAPRGCVGNCGFERSIRGRVQWQLGTFDRVLTRCESAAVRGMEALLVHSGRVLYLVERWTTAAQQTEHQILRRHLVLSLAMCIVAGEGENAAQRFVDDRRREGHG